MKSPTQKERIVHTFNTPLDSGYIKIESLSNLALSNLVLYSGEPSDAPRGVLPAHGEPVTVTGITDNRYTFTGLDPQKHYLFRVQAQNDYTRSDESVKLKVGTALAIDEPSSPSDRYIVTDQNILYMHGQPGDLVTVVAPSGQILFTRQLQSTVTSTALPRGLYLVCIGPATFKTILSYSTF